MKLLGTRFVFIGLLIAFSCSLITALSLPAGADTVTMLNQVKNEIRQAEKDMFAGNNDKAIAALENIKDLLLKLKGADPGNTSVKTLENKYQKLLKDLERRTGKDLGGGTLTASESSTITSLPSKPTAGAMATTESIAHPTDQTEKPARSADQVPYAARKPLSSAAQLLNSLDKNLDNLADPNYSGNKDQLVENAEAKLLEIRSELDEAKALAAEKGVVSHPSFDELETKLIAAEKKVAGAKGDYQKAKSEAFALSKEVEADVAALKSEYDRVSALFEQATGSVIYYNDLKPVEELIAKIEEFEQNEVAQFKKKMEAFAGKYGSTKEEIDQKAETMGYSGQYRASFPYTALAEGIENIQKTRVVMAEDLAQKANDRFGNIGSVHDFCVAEQFEDVKTWLKTAGRYDPENSKVKEALAGIDQRITQGLRDFHARIDRRTWPEHASDTPKDAEKLAKAALAWFKASPDWGKRDKDPRQPLAVAVTGPWSIQKTNLLGEPIMYGLPILLAVEVESDKQLNVARVYALTLRTAEMRGVKMEPPFDHVTVGDSYFIRPAALR